MIDPIVRARSSLNSNTFSESASGLGRRNTSRFPVLWMTTTISPSSRLISNFFPTPGRSDSVIGIPGRNGATVLVV